MIRLRKQVGHRGVPNAGARRDEWTIQKMMRNFGVTARALRFWEERGLLAPRREDAVRRYGEYDRKQLSFLLKAKRLGFTINEIGEIMSRPGSGFDDRLRPHEIVDQLAILRHKQREIGDAVDYLAALHKHKRGVALAQKYDVDGANDENNGSGSAN